MGRPSELPSSREGYPQDAPPPYVEESPGTVPYTQKPPVAPSYAGRHPPIHQGGPSRQINRQFPPAFSMYRGSAFDRTYMLGVSQNQPLYAVSLHTGWSGQPDVVLHSGPDDSLPPLATIDASSLGRIATATLPSLPGAGQAGSEERMESAGGFGVSSQLFSIEVGVNGRRERFEWRHSHGAEVDSLGGRGSGWKLVRLDSDSVGGLRDGAQFTQGGARASDGKEVVAVWAAASMSMSKTLNFRFLGTGASGVLGERWAVMAVITALRIWDKQRKANRNTAAQAA